MAKKITLETRIRKGDLIAWKTADGLAVYQVAKIEKKKGMSPCICLNHSPGDKEFIKENKVDWYTRIHQSDLVKSNGAYNAEIISVIELITHFDHSRTVIRDLKHNNSDLVLKLESLMAKNVDPYS